MSGTHEPWGGTEFERLAFTSAADEATRCLAIDDDDDEAALTAGRVRDDDTEAGALLLRDDAEADGALLRDGNGAEAI